MRRNLKIASSTALGLSLGLAATANAANGPMAFEPIEASAYTQLGTTWAEPFLVPDGYSQRKVLDETGLDVYAGVDDLTDMNTTNETGRQAGRYLYRDGLGILRHEGIGVASDGSVFVIDELNGGSIFRFVPDRRGDLSSGKLHALRLNGLEDAAQNWNSATFTDKVGAYEWVALDMALPVVDAKAAADLVNATEFGRPEDVEIVANVLYVANTSEERVIAIDLKKQVVTSFVLAGTNVPVEDRTALVTGFNNPDNLVKGPDGAFWIVEDNVPSDIWVAYPTNSGVAAEVELFASLTDSGAEGSGIYFGKDPHTLFVNVQHPAKDLADGTWAITRD